MAFRPLMKVAVRRAMRGINEAGTLGFEAPLTIEYPRKRHILYHICAASRKCRTHGQGDSIYLSIGCHPTSLNTLFGSLQAERFSHPLLMFFTRALHTCSSHVERTPRPFPLGQVERATQIAPHMKSMRRACEKRSPVSSGNGVQLRFLGLSRIFRQGCAMPWHGGNRQPGATK